MTGGTGIADGSHMIDAMGDSYSCGSGLVDGCI